MGIGRECRLSVDHTVLRTRVDDRCHPFAVECRPEEQTIVHRSICRNGAVWTSPTRSDPRARKFHAVACEVEIHVVIGKNVRSEKPVRHDAADLRQIDRPDQGPETWQRRACRSEAGQFHYTSDHSTIEAMKPAWINHASGELKAICCFRGYDGRLGPGVQDQDRVVSAEAQPNERYTLGQHQRQIEACGW